MKSLRLPLARVLKFRSPGLRQRLIMGIGLIVALLLVLATGSVWQLRSMGAQIARIVEGHGHRSVLAQRLNAAQLEWAGQLRVLLTMTDAEDIRIQLAALASARERYGAAEGALMEALKEGTGADADALRGKATEIQRQREMATPAYESAERSIASGAGLD